MSDPFERQTGKTETRKVMEEYQEGLIQQFLKIIKIIESDYHYMTRDDEKRDPSELDWDTYRLILRNYVNIVLSAPKALEMQRLIDSMIVMECEDFDSVTTELYTRFIGIVKR